MVPLCSIHIIGFKNLASKYRPRIREKMSQKVYFLLDDLRCNIRRDEEDDHVKYNPFDLKK